MAKIPQTDGQVEIPVTKERRVVLSLAQLAEFAVNPALIVPFQKVLLDQPDATTDVAMAVARYANSLA